MHFGQLDIHQAKALLDKPDVVVVDIRDPQSFAEGHLPKALSLTDDNVEQFLKETPRTQEILCYCYHGISSQSAAQFLSSQGFEKVYSMIGGYEEWRKIYHEK